MPRQFEEEKKRHAKELAEERRQLEQQLKSERRVMQRQAKASAMASTNLRKYDRRPSPCSVAPPSHPAPTTRVLLCVGVCGCVGVWVWVGVPHQGAGRHRWTEGRDSEDES